MLALAAISPGLAVRASNEVPHPLSPHTDALATLSILLIGLALVAGAIRTVTKRQ